MEEDVDILITMQWQIFLAAQFFALVCSLMYVTRVLLVCASYYAGGNADGDMFLAGSGGGYWDFYELDLEFDVLGNFSEHEVFKEKCWSEFSSIVDLLGCWEHMFYRGTTGI